MRSTALARFSMDNSVSRRRRLASAGSQPFVPEMDGSRKLLRRSSAKSCILSDCVPSCAAHAQGQPDDDLAHGVLLDHFSNAARSVRLFRRCRVSRPCAVMPSGSDTAKPILRAPTSRPRMRPGLPGAWAEADLMALVPRRIFRRQVTRGDYIRSSCWRGRSLCG